MYDKATIIPLILDRIAAGESMNAICRDPDMPGYRTVTQWFTDDPELDAAYTAATEKRADVMFEQILEIADRPIMQDVRTMVDDGGGALVSIKPIMQHRAQQIDARKWMLGKMSRRYADKTVHSNDPDNPMPVPSFTINPIKSGTYLGDASETGDDT